MESSHRTYRGLRLFNFQNKIVCEKASRKLKIFQIENKNPRIKTNDDDISDVLPLELCEDAVDVLCDNLLPFILVSGDTEGRGNDYVPAMLQTVMYKAPQDTVIHRKLVECIMTYKVCLNHVEVNLLSARIETHTQPQ